VPRGAELAQRLASVLEVIYLIFNEGYSATVGDDWVRSQLCEEALRLGRILAALAPDEPEVHGLIALMEIQASRLKARTGPSVEPILLLDQDRALGPAAHSPRLAALERAACAKNQRQELRPYALQAAIAACHARARAPEETDWARIVGFYGALVALTPSPVVELNRAVALAMLFGPAAGIELIDKLTLEPALRTYHLLPSVRGDLLKKLGRLNEARAEFERAASSPGTSASASCCSPASRIASAIDRCRSTYAISRSQVFSDAPEFGRSFRKGCNDTVKGGLIYVSA
jgi:RNA polymerase sigma-70 factor (ECF subfamily)